jgi:RimJ/RimL family protein N-acetyltransferase
MRDALYVDLANDGVGLEKLEERHREALRRACAADGAIWEIYSSSFAPDRFDAAFSGLIQHADRMPYAIVVDGAVVGMTAWLRPDWSAQTVEIGNSYLCPDVRGSGLNGKVKQLMLNHAFGTAGIRRVEFRIDERNARSQAAVLKLGAAKEGVLRAERVTWTGHVRDTGLFSILAGEWRGQASALVQDGWSDIGA